MIVHLNGWPGVGKLTVARLLAPRLQARLIDNHLLHDVAIRCTGIDDPARWPLYEAVRAAAYQALADRPRSETFVMTNALCLGAAREREAWRHVVALAETRAVPLVPVVERWAAAPWAWAECPLGRPARVRSCAPARCPRAPRQPYSCRAAHSARPRQSAD